MSSSGKGPMFIQKVTIHGFKSFVDKVELGFGSGLTGIIGPNGCGKTNITDALRWVLGEQRATVLRGATMEDVIFSGSTSRKPLGMAEVSVVLSNARGILPVDWPEVVVTRRVYRSGVSEYLLNKTPCRLRDIRDLFYDTGVGSNAYSVIERQMVDNVLSDSGGHRRFLFEEAAGVMKYKARRREALLKLEATEGDLTRLGDIMSEVEREVRSLLYQAQKARRWVRLRDEILSLELSVSASRRTALMQMETEMAARLEELVGRLDALGATLQAKDAERTALMARQIEIDNRLGAARESLRAAEARAADSSQELGVLRERLAGRKLRLGALGPEEERLVARIEQCRAQMALVQESLAGVDVEARSGELGEAEARLTAAETHVRGLRSSMAEHQQFSIDFQRTEVETRAQRDRVQSDRARLDATAARIEEELADLTRVHDERRGALERLDARLGEFESQLAAGQLREAELLEQIAMLTARHTEVGAQEREVARTLDGVRSRAQTLSELKAAWEGYDSGVRTLLDRENARDVGLLGVVADLIRVPVGQSDWVEAALAGAVQYVVTSSTGAAQAALEALAEAAQGKVTLQPLDRVRGAAVAVPREMLSRAGVVGSAIQMVECEDAYRPLAEALLGRVVLVENAAVASALAEEHAGEPWRFVTPEGQVWSGEGWVRGGVGGGGEGFLRREGELRELHAQIETLDAEHSALVATLQGLREELTAATDAQRIAVREREALTAQQAQAQTERRGVQVEFEQAERRIAAHTTSRDEVRTEAAAKVALLAELDAKLEQTVGESARREESLRELEQNLRLAEAGLSRELEATSTLRVAVARLSEQKRSSEEGIQRLDRELAESLHLQEVRHQERTENEQAIVELEAQIEQATQQASDSSEEVAKARAALSALEVERDEVTFPLQLAQSEADQARDAQQQAFEDRHRTELALTQSRVERAGLEERISSEYGVDLSTFVLDAAPVAPAEDAELPAEADDVAAEGEDADAAEDAIVVPARAGEDPAARLATLKEKFRRLGPVNELAVTEYAEKKERLDFLTRQRDDLVEAKLQLLEAISKINETAKALFLETFAKIQENLKRTFGALFIGGQADLFLNGDDPLEAEIEIKARPRGKQPQSLALLSGGEKALTAIALLFAIYQVKPSPYCILDEVDAPLDDANNERFTNMLREFSTATQFIVVTHNKQTMAACDAIYGVTMQEPGVSKLVSVKFDERQAAANGGARSGKSAAAPKATPEQLEAIGAPGVGE